MKVCINSEARCIEPCSVAQLLLFLNIEHQRVVVEINHEIIARSAHGDTQIQDGDSIEIIKAVGGG